MRKLIYKIHQNEWSVVVFDVRPVALKTKNRIFLVEGRKK